MRKVIVAVAFLVLSGCSVILPKPHDPILFSNIVEVKIKYDKISCSDKSIQWEFLVNQIENLKVYSELRGDPQAKNVSGLFDATKKAKESTNVVFCESVVRLNKTRIDVIVDAWRGR